MEKGWAKIWETPNEIRSEIAKQILEENDIEAILINKIDSFYKVGDIEIYVSLDDILRAKKLLTGLEP
jgi:hypothetical protein